MLKVREFEPKDYEGVYDLWQETGITLGNSDEYAEVIRFYTKNSKSFLVGYEEETGEIIGSCMGGFDGRRGYVHHLSVKESHERSGHGSLLMQKVMDVFKERGVKKVHIFIEKKNESVQEFYRKNGWAKRDDIIVMSKDI